MNSSFWKKVTLIGAAGKMGRGIALVLLQEMARDQAKRSGFIQGEKSRLNLVDTHEEAVFSLRRYLKPHLTRYAEKNINQLRDYFQARKDLVSNQEMINAFVEGALDMVHCDTNIGSAKGSQMVFEAVTEDIDVKDALYLELREICGADTHYFSNTSSIPISLINENARLKNQIIGFHFYNPPHVQNLIELIIPQKTNYQTEDLALEVAKRLNKTAVYSQDIAGFIGNGYFIREIAFACEKVQQLQKNYPIEMAITLVDVVTRDFLYRPMGIFQLIDFVGPDVCDRIALIMEEYLPERGLSKKLIAKMVERKFFTYEKNRPVGVFSLESGEYRPLPQDLEAIMGPKPHQKWVQLRKDPEGAELAIKELVHQQSLGAELAIEFLKHSEKVAKHLVSSKVAKSTKDVDTVLKIGFQHLYSTQISVPELIGG